jgi:hypothetical protein
LIGSAAGQWQPEARLYIFVLFLYVHAFLKVEGEEYNEW